MKKEISLHSYRFFTLTLIVLAAALFRIVPHPYNLSPLTALSLFCGTYFVSRWMSFLIPLLSIWISDLVINNLIVPQYFQGFNLFYEGFYWQYGSFVLIVCIGQLLKNKVKPLPVLVSSVGSSVLFFLVSNFGVWLSFSFYPHTIQGLTTCYIAGIPFFPNTLFGDLCFTIVFYSLFELLQQRIPALRLSRSNN